MNISAITAIVILLTIPYSASSQSHTLLNDINPGAQNMTSGLTTNSVKWNDKVYFIAQEDNIIRLWSTDGSVVNTSPILEVGCFGCGNPMAALEDEIILFGNINETFGLISSDGTAEGSNLYFPVDRVIYLVSVDSQHVVFIKNDLEISYFYGNTNGQTAGTLWEGNILIDQSKILVSTFGASILVSGNTSEAPYCTTLISDGHSENTKCLQLFLEELFPGEIQSQIIGAVGDGKHIFLETKLNGYFLFDGTSIESIDIPKSVFNAYFKGVYVIGDRTILYLSDASLIVFDHLTKSFDLLTNDVHDFAQPLLYNGQLYYPNRDGFLTKTDGTFQSIQQLNTQRIQGPAIINPTLFIHDDKLYYSVWDDGRVMRSYDLIENADSFFDIIAPYDLTMSAPSGPTQMVTIGDKLMYLKKTPEYGTEWWVYDPLSVSVKTPEIKSIICYPNPVKDKLQIQAGEGDFTSAQIRIYNANGMIVKNTKLDLGRMKIDVHDFVPGIYSLELISDINEVFNSCFVKE